MCTAAAGRPDTGGRRQARLRGRLAPAQLRGCPGGEKQPLLQPAPPRALLRQRLRRTREEGWARENEGTTSHSEASGRCQPPSSAALTGRRGTESGGRRARGNTWWRRRGGESALCDVIAKEAGLFVRAEPRRSRTSKEVQDAPFRSLKNLQLLSDPGKNVAKSSGSPMSHTWSESFNKEEGTAPRIFPGLSFLCLLLGSAVQFSCQGFFLECQLAACIMKLETLPVGPGVEPPMFRVDCIPLETAELNPPVCGYQEVGKWQIEEWGLGDLVQIRK